MAQERKMQLSLLFCACPLNRMYYFTVHKWPSISDNSRVLFRVFSSLDAFSTFCRGIYAKRGEMRKPLKHKALTGH